MVGVNCVIWGQFGFLHRGHWRQIEGMMGGWEMYDQGCSVSALYQWRRCIIYFVHLTNPVDTLRPSTTCRKFERRQSSIWQEGQNIPHQNCHDHDQSSSSVLIVIIWLFYGGGYGPLSRRWCRSGVPRPRPLQSAWIQWVSLFQTSLVHPFFSPKELLRLPVDSAKERELSRPRVNCESLAISFHNGVPNLMTHWLIQSASWCRWWRFLPCCQGRHHRPPSWLSLLPARYPRKTCKNWRHWSIRCCSPREPDGWEVLKNWRSVIHVLDRQPNLDE